MKKLLYSFLCLSIKKKLILSFSTLVILPILVSTLFFSRLTGDIVLEKINNANIESLNRTSQRLDDLLDDISFALMNLTRNTELNNILKSDKDLASGLSSDNTNKADFIIKQNEMNFIFDNVPLTILIYGSNITVLSDNGTDYGNWEEFFKFSSKLKENEWYRELMNSTSLYVRWIGINKSFKTRSSNEEYYLEAAMPIKEVREGKSSVSSNIGVIHMAISEEIIYELIKSDNAESITFLVDKYGNIMSADKKEIIGTPITMYVNMSLPYLQNEGWYVDRDKNASRTVISYSTISKTGWKVISITPYNTMMAPLYSVRNTIIIANLIFIFLFILVSLIISKGISRPIIRLNQQIKKVENGNLTERVAVLYDDEIGNLSRNFNNMLDDICNLLKLTKEQEKLKREAEFDALQAQINPHFLFNTLSSIRWTAAANGDTKTEEMVLALSNLLKMSIKRGPDLIPLAEELEMLRHYINLMQMKQGISFNVNYAIPDDLLKVRIPRLLLQPIVENSIFHGFGNRKEYGEILITATAESSYLKIEVMDNGKGIDADKMKEILEVNIPQEDKAKYFRSIGIRNVNERIKLNYGEECRVSMRNREGGGAIATLTLKYHGEVTANAENSVG